MLEIGEVAEWLKAHAWKACKRATVSRVRIPFSPPLNYPHFLNLCFKVYRITVIKRSNLYEKKISKIRNYVLTLVATLINYKITKNE